MRRDTDAEMVMDALTYLAVTQEPGSCSLGVMRTEEGKVAGLVLVVTVAEREHLEALKEACTRVLAEAQERAEGSRIYEWRAP